MNSNRGVANLLSAPFFQILAQPWLDRTIAFIAMVPTLYLAYFRYQHMRLGIPLVSFAIGTLIAFLTLILRRPPKRVVVRQECSRTGSEGCGYYQAIALTTKVRILAG